MNPRHTFASLLLQQGENPVYVQLQPGHASIQLTEDPYGRRLAMATRPVDRLDEAALIASGGELGVWRDGASEPLNWLEPGAGVEPATY